MIDFLREKNYKFWANLDEAIKDFKESNAQDLGPDEIDIVNLYALATIGKVASGLIEFYQNVYKKFSSNPDEKFNGNSLSEVVNAKIKKFTQNAIQTIKTDMGKERDTLELKLIELGYRGDTFATASNGLYKAVKNQTDEMSTAIDATIASFGKAKQNSLQNENTQNLQQIAK